jgi:hypothetical protein
VCLRTRSSSRLGGLHFALQGGPYIRTKKSMRRFAAVVVSSSCSSSSASSRELRDGQGPRVPVARRPSCTKQDRPKPSLCREGPGQSLRLKCRSSGSLEWRTGLDFTVIRVSGGNTGLATLTFLAIASASSNIDPGARSFNAMRFFEI